MFRYLYFNRKKKFFLSRSGQWNFWGFLYYSSYVRIIQFPISWFINVTIRQKKITSAQSEYSFSRNIMSIIIARELNIPQRHFNDFLLAITAGLPETSTGASKIIVMIMAIENSNSAKSLTAISDGRSITAKKTA